MSTKFTEFMQEIEAEAIAEGPSAVQELNSWREHFRAARVSNPIGEKMNSATYAFVFNGDDNWQLSGADDWDLRVVELKGDEKTLGHKKIDGSICKILQTSDGQLVAVTK